MRYAIQHNLLVIYICCCDIHIFISTVINDEMTCNVQINLN